MSKDVVFIFEDVFPEQQLKTIKSIIDNLPDSHGEPQASLGRLCIDKFRLPGPVIHTLNNLVHTVVSPDLITNPYPLCVEYNIKYGQPELAPHIDGDSTDLVFDFQLSSNTSWDIGVNKNTYSLKDNSAIAFNPNTNIHWRPIKQFEQDEFVRLIFFRFQNIKEETNYSNSPKGRDHPMYDEIKSLRLRENKI